MVFSENFGIVRDDERIELHGWAISYVEFVVVDRHQCQVVRLDRCGYVSDAGVVALISWDDCCMKKDRKVHFNSLLSRTCSSWYP